MDEWVETVVLELNLEGISVTPNLMKDILAVARDAAHNVERPAAPLTTYLMGIAVAQGADPTVVAEKIGLLATNWNPKEETQN
jgi:hypothetical protein